ncbi:MAG: FGGY family carbohydrate kinase [Cytophagales bacterium]|nr:FGGY family carbohydrate kinase [Cytophagales bacterium]MDW8383435.1 FGGY family carbohydrate kinase [Flammeovirgaceae bacterium]
MYLLGYDIGSSSVKATLLQAENGTAIASATSPTVEMKIDAPQPGWAEQHPDLWWENLKIATHQILATSKVDVSQIRAIGISYQMHGLVAVDKNLQVLRPAIIWCDGRAASIGEKAFRALGEQRCLEKLLNSPGNFTASKLRWVKENEPHIFDKIYKIMLPGDYIAARMSGTINTTVSGLSEGIFWNIQEDRLADFLLDYYQIPHSYIPDIVPTFSIQSELSVSAAKELGLTKGIPISYRAGDQPNNAFSLNALRAGEVAATAGTSGVVYGVNDRPNYDRFSRVNTFIHVNHTAQTPSYGVLLCINGTGIMNSWMKAQIGGGYLDYSQMNEIASHAPIGSSGLCILPFGNGAERILSNKETGAMIYNLQLNIHNRSHLFRAAQEGIVFALNYGFEVMQTMGIRPQTVRAGNANMFLSPLFASAFSTLTQTQVELYNTDGSQGAARGAGLGAGIYSSLEETFASLRVIKRIEPINAEKNAYLEAYQRWKSVLHKFLE